MELLGKHNYFVENNIKLCDQHVISLTVLYQPFIGAQGLSIFLLLYGLNKHTDYTQLCLYSSLSIEEVERALIKCEQYQLIQTYYNSDDESYIHVLHEPLLPQEFLNHYVFGLEYRQHMGNYRYNTLRQEYDDFEVNKAGYRDVTEKYSPKNFDNLSDDEIVNIIKKEEKIVLPIGFNYDKFFDNLTNLVFPHQLRTEENLVLIGELALLYGVTPERMRVLVSRSVDHEKMLLNIDDLINRVRYEEVVVDTNINKYELPPVAFLQRIQNGAAVTTTDKKLLEKLSKDMKMNREVINRLIEHVMESNNNVLIANYVLKLAATWKAHDVKTVTEANKLIDLTSGKPSAKSVVKRSKKKVVETETLTDQERENILSKIAERGKKNATTKN